MPQLLGFRIPQIFKMSSFFLEVQGKNLELPTRSNQSNDAATPDKWKRVQEKATSLT